MITVIDNRREYTEKRFQYFGGEVTIYELINSTCNMGGFGMYFDRFRIKIGDIS